MSEAIRAVYDEGVFQPMLENWLAEKPELLWAFVVLELELNGLKNCPAETQSRLENALWMAKKPS